MKTHKSLLCVGGPLSGQRFNAQSGAGFSVPVMSPEQIALPDKEAEDFRPNAKAEYTNHHYRAETFHTPQGDVEFWAPHDQTPLQSITILLEALAERARPEEAIREAALEKAALWFKSYDNGSVPGKDIPPAFDMYAEFACHISAHSPAPRVEEATMREIYRQTRTKMDAEAAWLRGDCACEEEVALAFGRALMERK